MIDLSETWNKVWNYFKEKEPSELAKSEFVMLKMEPRLYELGGGRGDRIQIYPRWQENSSRQRIVGWKPVKPEQGDLLSVPMGKGLGIFVISQVECPGDPRDMFYAQIDFVGYKEEGVLERLGITNARPNRD